MRKGITFTFWTLMLAIPFTLLALSLAAYLTVHFNDIFVAMVAFGEATTVGARGWMQVLAERWPEVAGMIIGQLVIMTILIFARRANMAENHQNT